MIRSGEQDTVPSVVAHFIVDQVVPARSVDFYTIPQVAAHLVFGEVVPVARLVDEDPVLVVVPCSVLVQRVVGRVRQRYTVLAVAVRRVVEQGVPVRVSSG